MFLFGMILHADYNIISGVSKTTVSTTINKSQNSIILCLFSFIIIMKIVKRVSLYRAVERLNAPTSGSPKFDHSQYNQFAPWKMPIDVELLKYGYRNKPRTYTMGILAVLAVLLGATINTTENQLRNNQLRTIYSYRLKETMQSTLWLNIRLVGHYLLPQLVGGQVFPLFEFFRLQGMNGDTDEKHIRYQQYKYYMKKRDDKYDFMELGVLEKFPYPLTPVKPIEE